MSAQCCSECFGDRGLRRSIIPSKSTSQGQCDYCHTQDVDLVSPSELADVFELLMSAYARDEAGLTPAEFMKKDWGLFPKLDKANATVLLGDILDDGAIVRQRFSASSTYTSSGLVQWETLKSELKHRNRYFLDEAIDQDTLKGLMDLLHTDDLPEVWYRARIITDENPYDIGQMGMPPRRLVSHGRANPPGIPYLYLGSLPETAIAEIRPHTGETACVADFTINGRLTAVDLRDPRKSVSPFELADASAVGQLLADLPFLERLGLELTIPVLPRGAAIDYIPSQFLCEFIKKSGYDGVVYRSSVSDGINLALFSEGRVTGGAVEVYEVSSVLVDVKKAERAVAV